MSKIDKYLDRYASKAIANGEPYQWWWNGTDVLAAMLASLCRHLRKEGHAAYSDDEIAQLRTLEKYMRAYASEAYLDLDFPERQWLHAEAMWLLPRWFERLWD